MNRRVLCVLLSALILISLLPGLALRVSAASNMKTSDACVEILKKMEGFVSKPIYDNGQYSVGYGSGCNKDDYPNGITEAEADKLLREYLESFEKSLNSFADRYSLTFTQNQFDALMLFTYNCGANWVTVDGEFRQAVITGAKGNDFIYPITLWSNSSSKLNLNLVRRRLIEADMYLNGSYANSQPANYTYVQFDNNGGISDVRVQGYDMTLAAMVKPVPVRTGYRFLGWYTAEEGGSWITNLNYSHAGKTLYAHWQKGSGDASNGTTASYQRSASQLGSQSIYEAPGSTKAVGSVSAGTTVTIVADYVDSANIKWGKLSSGGWVNLGSALVGVVVSDSSQAPLTVTVTNSYINVRSGPNTTYSKVGTVYQGQKLTITETRMMGSDLWGKFSGGWVSLMYTDYETVLEDEKADTTTVTATGTVVNCSTLRIRSGAGLDYPVVGSLACGTKVSITQQRTASGMTWGRISSGWISLDYVSLDKTTTDSGKEETTKPETDKEDTSAKVTGTVISNIPLNIRSAPGAYNARVGTYAIGTKLEILEQKDLNGDAWGRTDKGWVCMQYVRLDSAGTGAGSTDGKGTMGTVVSNVPLNIRTGAGTHNTQIGTYANGSRIEVLELTTVNGQIWGRTSRGWVCMTYVQLDSSMPVTKPETTPDTPVTDANATVISFSPLNIRAGAGTFNAQVGTYPSGTRIKIGEQTTVNGQKWGQTDKGWVCMDYVALDSQLPPGALDPTPTTKPGTETTPETDTTPETETKPETKEGNATVISYSPLNIRSAAGAGNAQVGTYERGTRITILEQTISNGQTWGRTDKGWVCMTYVQLDTPTEKVEFTGTVNTNGLRIRSAAGTQSAILGTYNYGDKVEVLETTKVGDVEWGRTVSGWICLDYVNR